MYVCDGICPLCRFVSHAGACVKPVWCALSLHPGEKEAMCAEEVWLRDATQQANLANPFTT